MSTISFLLLGIVMTCCQHILAPHQIYVDYSGCGFVKVVDTSTNTSFCFIHCSVTVTTHQGPKHTLGIVKKRSLITDSLYVQLTVDNGY